ncbi:MAG: hypothetical protein LBF59_03185 [Prevotellaceae bacterium]|jgi:hypothetical protein|nr:hypothetical protein [Prevotellaceae bacterium]
MARLLYRQDSLASHTRLTRRHIRLCGQVKGGASYAQAIQPKLDNLIQKGQALSAAEEVTENSYDDLVLKDSYLDDSVRTLFERSRQYDRENGGNVSVLLFPDLTYSDIINMPYSEEPKKVSSLIQKLETLEPTHELRSLAGILQQKVDAVNTALDARQLAADNVRKCQTDVELAKNEVRAQYEANYLDARKSLGKYIAESLFPKVIRRKSKSDEGDVDSETEE